MTHTTVLTLLWFALIALTAGLVRACRSTGRPAGPSWFDLQPHMRPSKKARGRACQRR